MKDHFDQRPPDERPLWWETALIKDHSDERSPDERPLWWEITWWKTTLMRDNLMKDHFDERSPDERPLWWETTLIKYHFDERTPWLKTNLMRDHPDKSQVWWASTLLKQHPDYRPAWWNNTLTTDQPDETTPWLQTSLMKQHPDYSPLSRARLLDFTLVLKEWFNCKNVELPKATKNEIPKTHREKLSHSISIYASLFIQDCSDNAREGTTLGWQSPWESTGSTVQAEHCLPSNLTHFHRFQHHC